ncbi:MAG: formylglycine-generating enzyme family protein [Alistipes sp.]|nr:formylglycine-generating enzyme family protein [Alistipes sp.]
MRKYSLIFLCVAMLLPSIAKAQFFDKVKVVVWEILDNNNDVTVSAPTRYEIRNSIESAFVNSRQYEAFEVDIDDVKSKLSAKGMNSSPINIAKILGQQYSVDYVVFTRVGIKEHAASHDNFIVNLASQFFSTTTLKNERMAEVDMRSDIKEIPGACAKLVAALLNEVPNGQSSATSQSRQSGQTSYQLSQTSYTAQQANSFIETANGLNMKMIFVEGGTFTMGASSGDRDAGSGERPAHQVTLDSYYIAEFEVTQSQWEKVMGTTVYQQRDKVKSSYSMAGVGDNYPMYYVSYEEARMFCEELSLLTGKTYLLPTEAQWEFAAKGGNKGKNSDNKYSGSCSVDAVAWYTSNSNSTSHSVGQKRANQLGIYDMSGNVWEWCSDWYGSYSSGSQTNPMGPSGGQYRVLRGGSWDFDARYCRVSYRGHNNPSSRDNFNGFRVVCLP